MPRKNSQVIEHDEPDLSGQYLPPSEFLLANHPANDDYIRGIDHTQRQILHLSRILRPKQVQIIKTVFSGRNYVQTALEHSTTSNTVSRLVRSKTGQSLLSMLQYHLTLIEGPNLAQRRNMLWRIAKDAELVDPKTAIKAVDSLNIMTYKQYDQDNPAAQANQTQDSNGQVINNVQININQKLLPRGALD
tara:strand:- start:890 stop:1459 length:570 start_codon:yes stop_codon:yes gene_type:complete